MPLPLNVHVSQLMAVHHLMKSFAPQRALNILLNCVRQPFLVRYFLLLTMNMQQYYSKVMLVVHFPSLSIVPPVLKTLSLSYLYRVRRLPSHTTHELPHTYRKTVFPFLHFANLVRET